ncbi:hypothetical protein GCM10027062_19690 [Nocardioides hungaricus]
MNIDELLRETAPDEGRLRAETDRLRGDVLARATSGRRRRVRRPWRAGIAAAAMASVGVTGVAYAAGGVPALFSSNVADAGRDLGVPPEQVPDLTQIVDLTLPDGSRFAAWQGVSERMWCTAYIDQWDGRAMGSGGTSCSDSGPSGFDLNRVQIAWAQAADESTYYPVLFGDADDGTSAVRVRGQFSATGQKVDLTLPVDPSTGAFAVTLPGTDPRPWDYLEDASATFRKSGITVEFLDTSGAVTRTVDDLYS